MMSLTNTLYKEVSAHDHFHLHARASARRLPPGLLALYIIE